MEGTPGGAMGVCRLNARLDKRVSDPIFATNSFAGKEMTSRAVKKRRFEASELPVDFLSLTIFG